LATTPAIEAHPFSKLGIWRVIFASAAGTMIEWYDFFIFGSLAVVLSQKFYPPGNETFAYVAYLSTFAVGFVVRPFGALFFGRIGDLVGRKYAFLVTLSIMGGATALIGFLPSFRTGGWISPVVLILIRAFQGLAVGGEYGGAAVYVAEHVPDNRRGFYTSFIQITAMLGFFASLFVIVTTQRSMSVEAFNEWGWRIPFLLSIVLVTLSFYIRLRMKESPIFSAIKGAGKTSRNPMKEAFSGWNNIRQVLITLFGATAAQGVLAYSAEFYSLFYLQTILKVNQQTASIVVSAALLLSVPTLICFAALSDRVGRKWMMMAACLLGIVTWFPIYKAMQRAAGNNVISVGSTKNKVTGAITLSAMTKDPLTAQLVPAKEALNPDVPSLILLVFAQLFVFTMIYAPLAAYLVEAFPARIRYTSLSLPYHIGNGIFGGLLPVIGLSLCAATGNIYAGLYYPLAVCSITLVVGSLFLKETRATRIWDEISETPARRSSVLLF
jgi:MFS family permease